MSLFSRKSLRPSDVGVPGDREALLTGSLQSARQAIGAAPGGSSIILSANYTLTSIDDGNRFFCSATPTVSVPKNLVGNFGAAFFGAVNFTALTGVTLQDNRLEITGATNFSCVLIPTPAANSYLIEGNK